MLRLGGPMRVGGLGGLTVDQCLDEIKASRLPGAFVRSQVRCLLRYMNEVAGLQGRIEGDSGFEADTACYLDILLCKDEAELMRRVSSTRCLLQDFEEKRLEWRKQRKSVINAIGSMTARVLRFEDKERKTIALHALVFYKNVMATNDGAIPGESESTDGLTQQYKRHRTEISKIPMYADSILKMLKDIRKTVRASSKLQLQPGPNPFAQFLDEWWASVVQFLEQSSIIDAEKNAREVMQTLKKLKDKQEESKKREISRLLSKLDDNAGLLPMTGPLSELPEPSGAPPPSDASPTPQDTTSRDCGGLRLPSTSGTPRPPPAPENLERDRRSHSSEESELSTLPTAAAAGQEGDRACSRPEGPATITHQQHQQRVSLVDESGHFGIVDSRSSTSTSVSVDRGAAAPVSNSKASVLASENGRCRTSRRRPALTVCDDDGGGHSGAGPDVGSLRSPSSGGLRLRGKPILTAGVGGVSIPSRVSWEEDSQGTAGTMDTMENMTMRLFGARPVSGIPDSDDDNHAHDDGDDDDDDDDNDLFEAADNLDLGAVDLCATGTGADGHMTYQDQEELRLPAKVAGPPQQKGVEEERFSAALDFFRQEQHRKTKRPAFYLPSPSPLRTAASFSSLPTSASLRSPRGSRGNGNPFTPRLVGGSSAVRVRTPYSRSSHRGEGKDGAVGKAKAVTRRTISGERGRKASTGRDRLLSADSRSSGRVNPKTFGRSLSVYIPSSSAQATPTQRAAQTPTVNSSRRALMSPGVGSAPRPAFFG